MGNVLGIRGEDGVEWHAAGVTGDYVTLCGMDGDDPTADQFGTVEPKRGQKITCSTCHTIWRNTLDLRLTERNFDTDE